MSQAIAIGKHFLKHQLKCRSWLLHKQLMKLWLMMNNTNNDKKNSVKLTGYRAQPKSGRLLCSWQTNFSQPLFRICRPGAEWIIWWKRTWYLLWQLTCETCTVRAPLLWTVQQQHYFDIVHPGYTSCREWRGKRNSLVVFQWSYHLY